MNKPIKQLMVHAYKYNGWLYRIVEHPYLLYETNNTLCLYMPLRLIKSIKNKEDSLQSFYSSNSNPLLWFFFKDAWFNVIVTLSKNADSAFYVNVASPYIIEENALKYVDLDIDFKISTTGNFKILDIEEYFANAKKWQYPKELKQKINQTKQEITNLINNKWFEKLINSEQLKYIDQCIDLILEQPSDQKFDEENKMEGIVSFEKLPPWIAFIQKNNYLLRDWLAKCSQNITQTQYNEIKNMVETKNFYQIEKESLSFSYLNAFIMPNAQANLLEIIEDAKVHYAKMLESNKIVHYEYESFINVCEQFIYLYKKWKSLTKPKKWWNLETNHYHQKMYNLLQEFNFIINIEKAYLLYQNFERTVKSCQNKMDTNNEEIKKHIIKWINSFSVMETWDVLFFAGVLNKTPKKVKQLFEEAIEFFNYTYLKYPNLKGVWRKNYNNMIKLKEKLFNLASQIEKSKKVLKPKPKPKNKFKKKFNKPKIVQEL